MPEERSLASQISIKLDGQQVQESVMAKLTAATVDQNVHLPGMFVLRFNDFDLALTNDGPFNLTKEVEISAQTASGDAVVLIKGEITALEPEFDEGMICSLVVRGFDRAHRLYRETRSTAFLNTKDSDIASQIASSAGLQAEVETTTTIYDHLFQHNQTDLDFLMERAWRIGYECFVADGKLYFRKPPQGGESLRLTWGDDLLTFRPRMSLAEQVDEVMVKGWDSAQQQAIVGRSQNGQLYPQNGEQRNGTSWASSFGAGKLIIVDQPVVTQAEADLMAEARMNEISGAFVQAEGTAFRRPDVQAGRKIELQSLGARFSGTYLVTGATHHYAPSGLKTTFTVRGLRTGLLAEGIDRTPPVERWPGVYIGVVTNTTDPEQLGRVKVKFPWMTEDTEGGWARVLGIGAGDNAGLFAVPGVGDEVLVAFEYGIFDRPYILGGLWNGQAAPPQEATQDNAEGYNVRTWRSRAGHRLVFRDAPESKIELITVDGRKLILSDQDQKITVENQSSKIVIEGSNIKMESSGNFTLEVSGNIKLKAGGNLDLESGGVMNIKGSLINLNS